jgi:flagellar basal-body rod protein FlgG
MIPHVRKQELSANNLANASASGFKKDSIFTRQLSQAEKKARAGQADWMQPMVDKVYTDYSPGVFDHTGNPLDLAIDGDGFFKLETLDGQTLLTRSGSFAVNAEGQVVFPGGARLVGEGGPIEVGGGTVSVSFSGEVEVNGMMMSRIVPVTVADLTKLQKIGGSTYVVPEGAELISIETATIRQGYLETSNVDIVSEMVNMISSYRSYEANAKSMQSQDESLGHLFNRVAGRN